MFCALLVENNETLRSKLDWMLKRHFPGIATEEAASGSAAMRQVRFLAPDMVLVSINLPGESGIRLIEDLKQQLPAVTVVALSNYDLPEYRRAAMRSGADCFISKDSPSFSEDLLERVGGVAARIAAAEPARRRPQAG